MNVKIGQYTADLNNLHDIALCISATFKGRVPQNSSMVQARQIQADIQSGKTSGTVHGAMFTVGLNAGKTPTREWVVV